MKTLLTISLFLVSLTVLCQDISNLTYHQIDSVLMVEFGQKRDLRSTYAYAKAALERATKELGEKDTTTVDYLGWMGYLSNNLGHLYEALEYDKKLVAVALEIKGEESLLYTRSISNLALTYKALGMYENAEQYLLKNIEIEEKVLGADHPSYAISLNNLGGLYADLQQYEKSVAVYLEAKEIFAKTVGKNHHHYTGTLANLAGSYGSMGQKKKSIMMLSQIISILEAQANPDYSSIALYSANLAKRTHHFNQFEKAEKLYKKAIRLWTKTIGYNHPKTATAINNLGVLYSKMERYEEAVEHHFKSLKIKEKLLDKNHLNIAVSYISLAATYRSWGKLDKALYYALLSIDVISHDLDSTFLQALEEGMDPSGSYGYPYTSTAVEQWSKLDKISYQASFEARKAHDVFINILQDKYLETGDKQQAELHLKVIESSLRWNNKVKNHFTREEEKLRILENSSDIVIKGIETSYFLQKKGFEKGIFKLSEQNKGVLLANAAQTERAYNFGDLPDSLVQKEKKLQKKLANLDVQIGQTIDKQAKEELVIKLNRLNRNIDIFSKYISEHYPKYATIKYKNNQLTVEEIQDLLPLNSALIEYTVGYEELYIIYIDKKQIKVHQLGLKDQNLDARIKDLHKTLSDYKLVTSKSSEAYNMYTRNAFWFYNNLLRPVIENVTDIKELIIIPDKELGYLPFEAFLMEEPPQSVTPYQSLHYLVNDYNISYNYSANLWKQNSIHQQKKDNPKSEQIIAMVSDYEVLVDSTSLDLRLPVHKRLRSQLKPLPAARKEVDELAKHFEGTFYFGRSASESIFKNEASHYGIIHLAMHGILDSKAPIMSSLAFTEDSDSLEDNFLHAYEISKMNLNTDLVILSACETGYGKFEKGNGIASLARAFMYAGAPSLIVSLWQVNDYATSEIMKNTYHNLAEGKKIDEALRYAKLKYIKSAKGIFAHPAFWSPFIQIGNTKPVHISRKGDSKFWWIGGLTILILLGGFILKRRQKTA